MTKQLKEHFDFINYCERYYTIEFDMMLILNFLQGLVELKIGKIRACSIVKETKDLCVSIKLNSEKYKVCELNNFVDIFFSEKVCKGDYTVTAKTSTGKKYFYKYNFDRELNLLRLHLILDWFDKNFKK